MASVVLLVPFKTNSVEPFGGQQDSRPPTAVEMAHFVLVGYVGSRVWGGVEKKKTKLGWFHRKSEDCSTCEISGAAREPFWDSVKVIGC